ncbi:uncharacterized protein L969DRAFT_43880 [Mixia osmundae IAM 14324]|uniref:sphingolipid 4-desaturase n=1 Tax=Mixia osmundae (strain CBS 9802 / IAM 14324 / JCM 22182 / KY 12970) TaxID=764103 RepID=G7DVD7_MIXOS|nr:uncharacterized protein L969DRAFT_43880 [Mixia osmundae IAM 14324]KEI42032.1 hypothetical protein L969DRAFT_43880 [Mixia osmundae IAM 14324]GAA94547.1 hypothetical protein E5Q_01199 [Mixia osmundae IAM 14324]
MTDWSLHGGAEALPVSHANESDASMARGSGTRLHQPSIKDLSIRPAALTHNDSTPSLTDMSAQSSSSTSEAGSDSELSRSSSRTTLTSGSSDHVDDEKALHEQPQLRQRHVQKASDSRRAALDELAKKRAAHSAGARDDWLWTMTEEPHRTRRIAILKDHPEIRGLMGHEPLTKYVVLFVLAVQFACAWLLRNSHPFSWPFFLTAYIIGGTANQNTFLAIHEITHNLAFRGVKANKLFAILANLPIGVPYAMMFKRYHMEHHRQLGEDGVDTDLPTKIELMCLRNVLGKTFFCTFQILFYALRPGFVRSQAFTRWHALNFLAQFGFDALLVRYVGGNALTYLIMSSFFAGSLHPCAAHFIAEHYIIDEDGQETTSYYGPLNVLAYNVGLHNEHHDFPNVPWTRLRELNKIAHEYYDDLPSHTSWPMVTVKFIFNDSVGLFSRIKRLTKQDREAALAEGDADRAVSSARCCESDTVSFVTAAHLTTIRTVRRNAMVKSSDILLILLAILFPPAAVAVLTGCSCDVLINVLLTLLGYIPGHIHAFYIIFKHMKAEESYGHGGYRYAGNATYEPIGAPTQQRFPAQPQQQYEAPPSYGATK